MARTEHVISTEAVDSVNRKWIIAAWICIALVAASCSSGSESLSDSPAATAAIPTETSAANDPSTATTEVRTEASTADEPSGSTVAPVADAQLPANPASAEITLDAAATAAATIGPDGGSVTASGTDGRRYSLTVPPGFMAADTEVTMTPIADLSTPVLDQFLGGVQFEPEGLVLPGVAWLEIMGVGDVDDLVGFMYRGAGDEVALGRAESDGATIRVPISHFSGGGAGTPAPEASDYPPSRRGDRKGHELEQAYIANEFECLPDTHPVVEGLLPWYQQWWSEDVEPQLETAASDDLVLSDALTTTGEWIRFGVAHGGLTCSELPDLLEGATASNGEPATRRAATLAAQGLEWAIDTAADVCADTHDLGEVTYIADWAGAASLVNLLFEGTANEDVEPAGHADWPSLMQDRVLGCLTFELRFKAHLELTEPPDGMFTADMKSTIPDLHPAQIEQVFGGQDSYASAPLDYTPTLDIDTGDPNCRYVMTNIQTSNLSVVLPEVPFAPPQRQVPIWNHPENPLPDPEPKKSDDPFLLVIENLDGSEFIDVNCSDLFGGPNPDGAFGPYYYNILHEDEFTDYWPGMEVALKPGSGEKLGEAQYERDEVQEGTHVVELTKIQLIHTAPGDNRKSAG